MHSRQRSSDSNARDVVCGLRGSLKNWAVGQLDLVGGWTNPFEKYDRQSRSFPQVGSEK